MSNKNLKPQDDILNNSRLAPTGSGNDQNPSSNTPPTNGQKWTAAILIGLMAGIIYSPVAYKTTSAITTRLGGMATTEGPGANLVGLLLHTLIFIILVRLILW